MSKSLDNYIGVDEAADTMFEKCMRVPDAVLPGYFRLTCDLPEEEYAPLLGRDMRAAHLMYAREIVRLYHGPEAVAPAEPGAYGRRLRRRAGADRSSDVAGKGRSR